MIFKATNGAQILEKIEISEADAMQAFYPTLNHALVIVKIDDDYLLGFHKWRDDWETFGGLIEEGESLPECIKREIEEELGLTDVEPTYLGIVHYLCPPDYWNEDWHEEYGGLYGMALTRDNLQDIEELRRDKDEIGEIEFYSKLKQQKAKVDEINEKLLEFY